MREPVRGGSDRAANVEVDRLVRRLADVELLGRVAVAANEADDVGRALDEGLSLLGRHAGCVAATVWLRHTPTGDLEPSGRWFRTEAASPALVEAVDGARAPALGSLPGRVESSRAPVWLVGLDRRGHWLHGADDDALGIATAFGVPVWADGERFGVLVGFYRDQRSVDAGLLELLEEVATQLGAVIRRSGRSAHVPSWLGGSSPTEVAAVAHRVRTPLIGVLTPLELLLTVEDDAERRELLGVALDAARDLHGLLEDALRGVPIAALAAGDEGQRVSMR